MGFSTILSSTALASTALAGIGDSMSSLQRAKISSLATFVPPLVLSTNVLESNALASVAAESTSRTAEIRAGEAAGVRQRHIVEQGTASSDLAAEAAQRLLSERGISPSELDAIFVATVTPDMRFPATACIVQEQLGAKDAWGFDISAGCSGFVYALQVGVKFVENGAHKKVLVVGVEVMSSISDFNDPGTCAAFGDGAGAVLIEPATDENHMIDFLHETDSSGASALYVPGGGSRNPASHETVEKRMHYVQLEGSRALRHAPDRMAEVGTKILKRNQLTAADIALFVPSQPNPCAPIAAAEQMGIPEERVLVNIDEFGNTVAATIPLALDAARRQGRLQKGDLVLLASVGAGLTCGATLLRWAF